MSEGINLLEPNKNTKPADLLKKLQVMRIVTVGLLFIISVSSVILFILVTLSPLPALQRQESFLHQTLLSSKSDIVKLALVNTQTTAIQDLLTQRKMLDEPLSLIQNKLTSDMTVTELQADGNRIIISVESPNLQSIDTFLNGIVSYVQEKKTFSKVTMVDLTTDQVNNAYVVSVQLSNL
jgi:hypothetical protein